MLMETDLQTNWRTQKSGGLAGTRTPDQCLKRALLYQLSYQPTKGNYDNSHARTHKIFRGGSRRLMPSFGNWQRWWLLRQGIFYAQRGVKVLARLGVIRLQLQGFLKFTDRLVQMFGPV